MIFLFLTNNTIARGNTLVNFHPTFSARLRREMLRVECRKNVEEINSSVRNSNLIKTCKRRRLATNEERRSTAVYLKLVKLVLADKLRIRGNYGNRWSNYVAITSCGALEQGGYKEILLQQITGKLERQVYLLSRIACTE